MGCDIHFRVEYLAPLETVVAQGGQVQVVPESEAVWQAAEKLTRDEWWKRCDDLLSGRLDDWPVDTDGNRLPEETMMEWRDEVSEYSISYSDRFYTGRNYSFFYKLAGVRGPYADITPLLGADMEYEGRGLPEDVSAEVNDELDEADVDLHTRGWFTLKELLEADWSDISEGQPYAGSGFDDTLIAMQVLALQKCGGDETKVRCVFAFDN